MFEVQKRSSVGHVDVFDGFVDFLGVFEADGDGVDAGVAEGEAERFLAVGALGESAFADELHADDAHTFFLNLLDVLHDFRNVAGLAAIGHGRIHHGSLVIHADHGDLKPVEFGYFT